MYLERIEQNNTKLDEILVKVNELPESGGGAGGEGSMPPEFTYTGGYAIYHDTQGLWRLIMLTSGILTFEQDVTIDAFLVGGGGGGGGGYTIVSGNSKGGGGGGGGYVTTHKSINLKSNTEYQIIIGAGGTGASGSVNPLPSSGGSGGTTHAFGFSIDGGAGGGAGGNGTSATGGTGQSNGGATMTKGADATAREFGDEDGILFSAGGAGGISASVYVAGMVFGGNGGSRSLAGGSLMSNNYSGFVLYPDISPGATGSYWTPSDASTGAWGAAGGGSGYGGGGAGGEASYGRQSTIGHMPGGNGAAGAVVIRAAKEE